MLDLVHYYNERDKLIDNINEVTKWNLNKADEFVVNQIEDAIVRLGKKYPRESSQDPLFHFLFVRIITRDFNKKNSVKNLIKDIHFIQLYNYKPKKKINIKHRKFKTNDKQVEAYALQTEKFLNDYKKRIKRNKALIFFGSLLTVGLVITLIIITSSPQSFDAFHHKIFYNVDGIQYQQDVIFNQKYTIKVPTKFGYDFNGLYESNSLNSKQVVDYLGYSINKYPYAYNDATYYAIFTPKEYNIVINPNGGDLQGENIQTVLYETKNITNFSYASLLKNGYTLEGFYNDNIYTLKIADETGKLLDEKYKLLSRNYYTFKNDTVEVFARWEGNKYTVTLDANGGTLSRTQVVARYGQLVNLGIPSKDGYGFEGWYDGDSKITGSDGIVDKWNYLKDMHLTAHWILGYYSIRFENCNKIEPMMFAYNEPIVLPVPTRYKYDINPFWTTSDWKRYETGDLMPAHNLTLVAQWDTQGWEYISNFKEFEEFIWNTGINCKHCLVNDIYLTDEWQPIGGAFNSDPFKGEFDGNGYSISNLNRTTQISENSKHFLFYGLFGTIGKNSYVHDLTINNVNITPTSYTINDGARHFIGALAGRNDGIISNVTINEGTIIYDPSDQGYSLVGGLVGYNEGTINNCKVNLNLTASRKEGYCGGICAMSYGGKISNSRFDGTATSWGGMFLMGFQSGVSLASGVCAATNIENEVIITNFVNNGIIKANAFFGTNPVINVEDSTYAYASQWGPY